VRKVKLDGWTIWRGVSSSSHSGDTIWVATKPGHAPRSDRSKRELLRKIGVPTVYPPSPVSGAEDTGSPDEASVPLQDFSEVT
jgi:hypothetical protein